MQEAVKKWLEKLLSGKKFKNFIIAVLLALFLLCFFSVYNYLNILSHPLFNPTILSSYNRLKSAQVLNRTNIVQTDNNIRTLIFGGDVMLSRHVQTQQEKYKSYLSAWENIYKDFESADLAVINLESPFAPSSPYPTEGMTFRAKPDNILGLKKAGIDAVHLANNHFGNAGLVGMKYTWQLLTDNNIVYVGAGKNSNDAYQGKIVDINGWRVGLVGQSYDVPWYAVGENSPGIAVYDLEKLRTAIANLKNEQVDFIIAMFHGGIEYTTKPNQEQINFAHTAIEAGADLVIGHHPHWIQDAEEYQGKYIFYSLGNLIFDQNWSTETSQGLVVSLLVEDNNIKKIILKPVIIEENFRPLWANLLESENILKTVNLPFTYELIDNQSLDQ